MSAPSAISTPRLSDTSYAVLGLLDLFEPATPYQLKQIAQVSIFHFWSIPHTQLYTECARLAEAGLLDERREEGGRRRRTYRLSAAGRKACQRGGPTPTPSCTSSATPGLLKLFCGADPASLAKTQVERHERRLHSYQELLDQTDMADGMRLSVEAGIGHEREYVRFWSRLQEDGNKKR